MSFKRDIGEVVETGRGAGVYSCEWRIPDFLSLAGEAGDFYLCPPFDACGGRWWLRICPWGPPLDSVSLYLFRQDAAPPQTLDVTLGIRGAEGVENERRRIQEFSPYGNVCSCWFTFCSRSELTEQNSRLMPGNVLIVSLDLKSVVPSIPRDACTQTDCNLEAEVLAGVQESSVKRGGEKALEDLSKLLASGEDSDVTVQVGDVEFKVHRAILSARCPVLAAMFRHETEEKACNRIVIEDCEPDIFGEYLHYLYTGSVQSLTEQTIFGLYRTADKYLADDLKQQCLQHVRDTLSVKTFCDAVQLALTHGQSTLLEQAMDFATRNIRSIIRTVEWQNFNRDHPTEATEILIKALGPPS